LKHYSHILFRRSVLPLLLLLLLFLSLTPTLAWTDSCPVLQGLPALEEARHSTRIWANSWGALWSTAVVGQAAFAISTSNSATKTDLWVGAGSSALGLIPTWIVPPRLISEPVPTGCDSPERIGEFLDKTATNDSQNSGYVAHLSNVGVNTAVGLILGLGLGHWGSAAISLAAGIPLGELMIFTYPRSAAKLRDALDSRVSAAAVPIPGGGTVLVSLAL
jgi:hypothetical protein